MRTGQNPAKFLEERASEPERITVAILTHIPHLEGYYSDSLDVLKASLSSLKKHTLIPYDLLVFDNASGVETQTYLQEIYQAGGIQYLMLSHENIGKGKAWDLIFAAAPGEIIAYSDSDVYFEQKWLQAALSLMESYPNVGMVTCRPMRTYPEGHTATVEWVEREPEAVLEKGNFLDWETFREHDISLGQDEGDVRARYESTSDLRVEYHGEMAFIGAAHWQFVALKKVLQEFLPLGIDRPLGDDRKLDNALNQAGYLRLMTPEPLVRHMGNTLPEGLETMSGNRVPGTRDLSPIRRWLDWPPVKRLLLGIYNRIFRWYFYR